MNRLHAAVIEAGADIIHITPPVFDAVPIAARVLPAGRDAIPNHMLVTTKY